ncbi:auxin-responsive protein SAUR77 [Apium graveolens]|uniref:auxin-responsive protein SAUR77 n=1 Tax=Apium graveolens TaxID=4045 RepID=UPI003D7AE659
MECLVLPVSILRRQCIRTRTGYRQLKYRSFGTSDDLVRVVVGKDKREFWVDPFVLEENPFRVLIDLVNRSERRLVNNNQRVLFVDVDAILFEHMLWLMHNDSSSLFQLNLKEVIDFYAQD